jgi:Ca2+/H+ antiporter
LLSWLINPLALSFREVEIAALAAATVFTSLLLARARSTRWRGVALILAYVSVASAFFAAGER